jgi:hypothetical protein
VSPVRYELGYIPEDDILHSHRRENLKSYIALTGWDLQRRSIVSLVRYELGFISQKTVFSVTYCCTNKHASAVNCGSWSTCVKTTKDRSHFCQYRGGVFNPVSCCALVHIVGPYVGFLRAEELQTNTDEFVRFEVFMAVTMKNGVLWVTPCGSCKN